MSIKVTILLSFILFNYSGLAQDDSSIALANKEVANTVSSGLVVGISAGCSVDGSTRFIHSAGYSNSTLKTDFSEQTLNRTASLAKPMTAVAVMQLVEQGLLDLDKPIQTYLPNFPKKKKGVITTRQLLSHTSGIDGYKSGREAENKTEYNSLAEAVRVFQERELRFTPGTDFYYTTYGYVVLGLIIEKVSGQTYESYMQKHIWDKAGMKNTGVEKYGLEYKNKSSLYHSKKGKIRAGVKNNLSNRIPGGGLYTNLDDMLKFGNALLDHSLITEASLDIMRADHSLGKEGNPYGFGWFLYGQKPNENSTIGHNGEQTGTASQLMIVPQYKMVVVVLSNTSGTLKEMILLSIKLIDHCKP